MGHLEKEPVTDAGAGGGSSDDFTLSMVYRSPVSGGVGGGSGRCDSGEEGSKGCWSVICDFTAKGQDNVFDPL